MKSEQTSKRVRSRDLYCEDLAWYAQASDAAFGFSSGHGSLISQLERGTVGGGGVPETDLYNDHVVGWGNCPVGAVEKARRIERTLVRLPEVHLRTLTVHYGPLPAALREPGESGTAPMLFIGDSLAAVIVYLMTPKDLQRFLWCCERGKTGDRKAVRGALVKKHHTAAEKAVKEAHRIYYLARSRRDVEVA